MGIKPIIILRKIILLTTKNPYRGLFCEDSGCTASNNPPRLWRAIIRQYSGFLQWSSGGEDTVSPGFWHTIFLLMTTIQTSGPQAANDEVASRPRRLRAAIILAALAALGLALSWYLEDADQLTAPDNETFMPITDPPPDPNRPDLFGEPHSSG